MTKHERLVDDINLHGLCSVCTHHDEPHYPCVHTPNSKTRYLCDFYWNKADSFKTVYDKTYDEIVCRLHLGMNLCEICHNLSCYGDPSNCDFMWSSD